MSLLVFGPLKVLLFVVKLLTALMVWGGIGWAVLAWFGVWA